MNLEKEFNLEKQKHEDFFLPYYLEKNWLVVEDNVGKGKFDYDVKLEIPVGVYRKVDEKVRVGDYGDFIVEIIQCIKNKSWGWFFSECEIILYGSWIDINNREPNSLYMVFMPNLKNYIYKKYKVNCIISKKGYGITYNIVLEWKDLIDKKVAVKIKL